ILCVLFPSGPLGRITLFCMFLMHFRHNGTFGIKTEQGRIRAVWK
ncbi:hypothetical protein LINGRAHAP2_LOCUS2772, partial [Linum grandiflorum]